MPGTVSRSAERVALAVCAAFEVEQCGTCRRCGQPLGQELLVGVVSDSSDLLGFVHDAVCSDLHRESGTRLVPFA